MKGAAGADEQPRAAAATESEVGDRPRNQNLTEKRAGVIVLINMDAMDAGPLATDVMKILLSGDAGQKKQ